MKIVDIQLENAQSSSKSGDGIAENAIDKKTHSYVSTKQGIGESWSAAFKLPNQASYIDALFSVT